MRCCTLAGLLVALAGPVAVGPAAAAPPDDLAGTVIIYARGGALYRSDGRGRGEAELVKLPARAAVRALRSDGAGKVLLVDLGGRWSWLPLDGSARTLIDLPCGDGPAQLAEDAACVLCRAAGAPGESIIVNLRSSKVTPVAIPTGGTRVAGTGATRKLVWADGGGVWAATPGDLAHRTRVAPEAPLRWFLPSGDGSRAVGVYTDVVHEGRKTRPAELLMGFALDGQGARRKGIRDGIPLEWSHDNQWVLVQNGASACVMRALGGQYKCWKGYTAASLSPDGAHILLLGSRDAKAGKAAPAPGKAKSAAGPTDDGDDDGESGGESDGESGDVEESGGVEAGAEADDVPVPPPSGPLALYRGRLAGPFTEAPALVVRVIDGAAVWIPTPKAAAP